MNIHYLQTGFVWGTGLLGGIVEFVQGNYTNGVFILVSLMIVDFLSGLLKGAKNKRLKSAIMHMGILKKVGTMLALLVAYLLDAFMNGGQMIFTSLVTWVAIGNEGLSIVENLNALGVKLPAVITNKLDTLASKGSDQADQEKTK